jgi:lipoprotein-anchoring transpeptidase ErfK/SrfK
MRVSGRRISTRAVSAERFWQIAILTAAGTLGAVSRADAALYYWQDSDPGYFQPAPTEQPRRPKPHRRAAGKAPAEKERGVKPQGPLIIAVSIGKQKVRIFDDNGVFAEAPVSTGMPGHPTPTGVFSVIQKHKFHQSNIYSGAPMPYMQRITWSGVAMHAGVLPGYPASHGCIRMPMTFAVKMWNWTRMGARVFVTPGDIMSPVSISHPLLATLKVVPQPITANEPPADKPITVKADKGAPDVNSAGSQASLELRSSVGHIDTAKPPSTEPTDATSLREQTHTADASRDARAEKAPATMSDAPAGSNAPPAIKDGGAVDTGDASKSQAKSESKKLYDDATAVRHEDTVALDNKPGEASPVDAASGEMKSGGTAVAEPAADAKKDQARLADIDKTLVAKIEPKRGQIAVFISRKDSKLYVRQNFAPLFDMPITIAASDRPLGTHVFTAETDKSDANVLHWSVVSLPMSARTLQRSANVERFSRRRGKVAAAARPIEMKPLPEPDTPTEALERISIPADVMARINEALSTGSSIIVSDQGINQGETGEGTDFIVSLR